MSENEPSYNELLRKEVARLREALNKTLEKINKKTQTEPDTEKEKESETKEDDLSI